MHRGTCQKVDMEVRRQLAGVASVLPTTPGNFKLDNEPLFTDRSHYL